ncbi:hypothetical protein FHX10_004451 [Rhizobium sp. BK591]|nr:hypothetical protein [Rhizobium sp. BK591]
MFRLGADLKVYLHREPIDFRGKPPVKAAGQAA